MLLSLTQVVTLGILGYLLIRRASEPESLVAINQNDRFVAYLSEQFNLSAAIGRYDLVINAIEQYKADRGIYPPDLNALVPDYLIEVPGLYIYYGEKIRYAPEPEQLGGAPFTFYIYGHYPPPASMHGWELKHCPAELRLCGEPNDKHYHPTRINYRWIWVGRSAL